MPKTNFSYETRDSMEDTYNKIVGILSNKGYKINQDSLTEIMAKHTLSMTYYSHDLKTWLIPSEEKVKIIIEIDHPASKKYIDRITQELIKNLLPLQTKVEISQQNLPNKNILDTNIDTIFSQIETQIGLFKNIIPKQLQKEFEKTIKDKNSTELNILMSEKINPIIINYQNQIINQNLNPGEESLWVHDVTKGIFNKVIIEKWIISNLRAMKYFPVSQENLQEKISAVGLRASETVVMNQQRRSSGSRVGTFVGSGGRGFVGASTGLSQNTSSTYGDLVFLFNGKETFRFSGISDPHGVRRLIETIKKQST